jgi:hypothetical protein
MAEPYPRAFEPDSYRMGVAELTNLLQAAGWRGVQVQTIELDASWDSAETAASTLLGTPFGPLVSVLPGDAQDRVRNRLITKLGGSAGRVTVRTASNIAYGVK